MKVPVDAAILRQATTNKKNLSTKEVFFFLLLTIVFCIWMMFTDGVKFNSGSSTTSRQVKQNNPRLVETASPEQLRRVNLALRNKHPVSKALTMRSQTHNLAYYVGASFSINVIGGVDEVVGIWIMDGEKNNPNSTFSANEMAYQFSGMGRAKDTKIGASVVDSEAQALKRALKE